MAGSVNKVILIGNVGKAPEVRTFQNGDKVCNFSIATSETWKDKASGERKEKTEWHNIVIKNQNIVGVAERYLSKGSKVYIEGHIETRKYEKEGRDVYTTEIVVGPFRGEMTLLDSKGSGSGAGASESGGYGETSAPAGRPALAGVSAKTSTMDDDIPF